MASSRQRKITAGSNYKVEKKRRKISGVLPRRENIRGLHTVG